jgi:uncharacterized lipoprotein YmbA
MKLKIVIVMIIALCTGACFSSSASRFYMLNAIPQAAVSSVDEAGQNTVSICIGPLLLAEYLDRRQLCVRGIGHEVSYNEFHRWAEPLDTGVVRVLVENLSLLMGTARIDVFPWKSQAPADYQVRIMLIRFDGEPGGQAVLKARWSVEASGQQQPVFDRVTSIAEPVDSRTYEDLVMAQNKALEKLSREIAAVIKQASER